MDEQTKDKPTKGKEAEKVIDRDIMDSILGESAPLTERMAYELSQLMFDTKKILMISDLNTDQINYFFKIKIVDELFYKEYSSKQKTHNMNTFTKLFDMLLQLTISKNRESRREIVEMFRRAKLEAEIEKKRGMFFRR